MISVFEVMRYKLRVENITYAYNQASLESGLIEEFTSDEEDIALIKKYGYISNNLHTDIHECLGHGSGQLLQAINTDVLKNYYSPLEETRADLFALYSISFKPAPESKVRISSTGMP